MAADAHVGAMISSDIDDSDEESHQLTRKSNKTSIQFPQIVAESPFENDYSNLLYNGVHYSQLPIAHCRAQWNNLIVEIFDCNLKSKYYSSLKLEGYKGAKKKSTVVNQQMGQAVARRALKLGINCVRVVLEGVSSHVF